MHRLKKSIYYTLIKCFALNKQQHKDKYTQIIQKKKEQIIKSFSDFIKNGNKIEIVNTSLENI